MTDHRGDVEAIDEHVKALPGVRDTELEYSSSVELGDSLDLAVTLDPSATDAQAADVGRTFVDEFRRRDLGGPSVEFVVHYPPSDSWATFRFVESHNRHTPATANIADSLSSWLRAAKSRPVRTVRLNQPESGDREPLPEFTLALRTDATAADAEELQRSDAALANATWCISFGYCSTPDPPSDHVISLWADIVTAAGTDTATIGRTRPQTTPDQAETSVGIAVNSAGDPWPRMEQVARSVAPLLTWFGHPTALVVDDRQYYPGDLTTRSDSAVEIVVGGCYRHQPGHLPSQVELELSAQYEKC